MPVTNIEPLVRMQIAQLAGMDAALAVPAVHATLCEVTRAQFQGDSTMAALAIIENTLAYFREHQEPMPGLSISDAPQAKDVQ